MAIRALIREDRARSATSTEVDKVWLQTWIHGHADTDQQDGTFPFLNAAKREIAQLGQLKIDEVFPQHRFLVVRAKPDHPDAWLTNRLISDFVPTDFVSRYVFNKQGFYADYEGLSGALARPCCGHAQNHISQGQGGSSRAALRAESTRGMTSMLDPIVNFFTRIFQWIGRGIGFVIGIILWPFLWAGRWYTQRGWILKSILGLPLVGAGRPLCLFLLEHAASGPISTRTMSMPTTSRAARPRPARQLADDAGARRRRRQDLHPLGHRRRHRRPDRLQRQPECLDARR